MYIIYYKDEDNKSQKRIVLEENHKKTKNPEFAKHTARGYTTCYAGVCLWFLEGNEQPKKIFF